MLVPYLGCISYVLTMKIRFRDFDVDIKIIVSVLSQLYLFVYVDLYIIE